MHLAHSAVSPFGQPLFKAVLVVHLLAAMLVVGGGATLALLGATSAARADLAQVVQDLRRARALRLWCLLPASLVLLGCGFGLVALAHLSLAALWLELALGGWFVAVCLSLFYTLPATDELARQVAEGGELAALSRLATRLRVAGALETAVFALVVVDMVLRP